MLRRNTLHGVIAGRKAATMTVTAFAAMALALTACGTEEGTGADSGAGQSEDAGAPASSSAPSSSSSMSGEASDGAGDGDTGSVSGLQAKLDDVLKATPVTFGAQNAELTEDGKRALKEVADAAGGTPDAKLEVRATAGYPDAAQAKELSQQRADAVVQQLAADGVTEDRVEAVAVGNEGVLDDDQAAMTVDISAK